MAMEWPPQALDPKMIVHIHFADNLVNGTGMGCYRIHPIEPELKQFLRGLPDRYSLPRQFSDLSKAQQTLLDPSTRQTVRRQIEQRTATLRISRPQRAWMIVDPDPAREPRPTRQMEYILQTSEDDDAMVHYVATDMNTSQLDLLLAATTQDSQRRADTTILVERPSAADDSAVPEQRAEDAAAGATEEAASDTGESPHNISTVAVDGSVNGDDLTAGCHPTENAAGEREVEISHNKCTQWLSTESKSVQTEPLSAGDPEVSPEHAELDGNDSDETNAFARDDDTGPEKLVPGNDGFDVLCIADDYTLEVCTTVQGVAALSAMVDANFTDSHGNKMIPWWAFTESCKALLKATEVHHIQCSSTRHPSCPCAACAGAAHDPKRHKTTASPADGSPPLAGCTTYTTTDAPPHLPLSSCIVGDCYTSCSPLSPESCVGIDMDTTKRKLHKDNLYHGMHSICGICYAQLPVREKCLYTKQPFRPLTQAAVNQIASVESLGYDDMLRKTLEGEGHSGGATRGYIVRQCGQILASAVIRHNLHQNGDDDALWFLELLCSRRGSGGGRKLLKSLLEYAFACNHWRVILLEVLNGRCAGKRLVSYYSEFFRYDDDMGNSWRASTGFSMQDILTAAGGVIKLGERDIDILRDKLSSVCDHPIHGNPVMICTHPNQTLYTKQGRRYVDNSMTLENQRISIAESIKDQEQALQECMRKRAALSAELVHEVYDLVFEMIKRMSIHDEFERAVASSGFKPTLKGEIVKNADGWINQAAANDSEHRFREGSMCARFVYTWIRMAVERRHGLFDNGFGHGQLMAIAAIVCRCTGHDIPIAGCEMFAPRKKFAKRLWKRLRVDQLVNATQHSDEDHDRLFKEPQFRTVPYVVFCNAENFTECDKLSLSGAFRNRLVQGSTLMSLQPLFDRVTRRELRERVVKDLYANTWSTRAQSVYEYSH